MMPSTKFLRLIISLKAHSKRLYYAILNVQLSNYHHIPVKIIAFVENPGIRQTWPGKLSRINTGIPDNSHPN